MEYKKLIEIVKKQDLSGKDTFLLNNHNGELVNGSDENLLDSDTFSVEFIHEINKKLLAFQGLISIYDLVTIGRLDFIDRLDSLAQYYMKTQRQQDAELIHRFARKVLDLDVTEVIITKSPNLVVLNKTLHPDVIRQIPIRRVLYGFTFFRRLLTEDVLSELECACAY